MLGPVSLQQVLEVVAEFGDSGGASLGLVAWELCVDEELVAPAWQQAINHELIRPAGRDSQEQLWRLTSAGRAAARKEAPQLLSPTSCLRRRDRRLGSDTGMWTEPEGLVQSAQTAREGAAGMHTERRRKEDAPRAATQCSIMRICPPVMRRGFFAAPFLDARDGTVSAAPSGGGRRFDRPGALGLTGYPELMTRRRGNRRG